MKCIYIHIILLILLCSKIIAQPAKSVLSFKNSTMYENGKKLFSYKSNGEIVFFNPRSQKGEIEMKAVVTTPNGTPFKIDTLNIDTLNYKVGMIHQGVGQYESWIFSSTLTYYGNGNVKKSTVFTNGGKTGLTSTFDDNGRPIEKGNYLNGKKNGDWVKYDESGKIARKETYNNSGEQTEQIYYFPNGQIFQIETKNGNDKTKIVYFENGKMQLKKEIKNGNGEEIEYNQDGSVSKKNVFENGQIIKTEVTPKKNSNYTPGVH